MPLPLWVGRQQGAPFVEVGQADPGDPLKGAVLVASEFMAVVDDLDGSAPVTLFFEVRDGVPQCRRVEIASHPDGREVRSTDLRKVKIEDTMEAAVRHVTMVWEESGRSAPDADSGATMTAYRQVRGETPEQQQRAIARSREARRESRRKVTPELLQEVARVYRENVDGNPTMAVAEFTNREHRTAALYVKRARDAGLLGATSPGKKGEQ